MTERARAEHGATVAGLHLQLSRMLLASLLAAVAATGALIITVIVGLPGHPPPPPPGGTPGGPPPPTVQALAVFTVITGLFVLAWLAVIAAFCRDQILQRIEAVRGGPAGGGRHYDDLLADLRAQLAADRERELQVLEQRITELTQEYGEQRETDGYLSGMRVATSEPVNVRSIHRTPPQR